VDLSAVALSKNEQKKTIIVKARLRPDHIGTMASEGGEGGIRTREAL
jgi:hypothetical protein